MIYSSIVNSVNLEKKQNSEKQRERGFYIPSILKQLLHLPQTFDGTHFFFATLPFSTMSYLAPKNKNPPSLKASFQYLSVCGSQSSFWLSPTGLGYCFSFLPTVTILSQYFDKRRSVVTAVASTGECFAVFAFAPGRWTTAAWKSLWDRGSQSCYTFPNSAILSLYA